MKRSRWDFSSISLGFCLGIAERYTFLLLGSSASSICCRSVIFDPRRQLWSRGGLGGWCRWPCSTSRSVGQAFAFDTLDGEIGAGLVVNPTRCPIGVAEVVFAQVAAQMSLGHVLIDTIDAALEDGEITLNRIGVNVTPDVFAAAVVDSGGFGEVPRNAGVDVAFVGQEPAFGGNILADDGAKIGSGHVRHMETADDPAAFHQCHNRGFDGRGQKRLAGGFAANIGFVGFNGATGAAHGLSEQVPDFLHGFPNTMGQKPGGLESNAQGPMKLVAADPLFAGAK